MVKITGTEAARNLQFQFCRDDPKPSEASKTVREKCYSMYTRARLIAYLFFCLFSLPFPSPPNPQKNPFLPPPLFCYLSVSAHILKATVCPRMIPSYVGQVHIDTFTQQIQDHRGELFILVYKGYNNGFRNCLF